MAEATGSNVAELTKFYVYETPDGGSTLKLVGIIDSKKDRDGALRDLLSDPVAEVEGDYVALSENAIKLRHVSIRPKATVSPVELPTSVPEAPAEEVQETLA